MRAVKRGAKYLIAFQFELDRPDTGSWITLSDQGILGRVQWRSPACAPGSVGDLIAPRP